MNSDFEKSRIMNPSPHLDYAKGAKSQATESEIENYSWSIIGNVGLILLFSRLKDNRVGKEKKKHN